MDYDLYHDESKVDGYWHGYLLIPRIHRSYLLSLLDESRNNIKYFSNVNFKGLKCSNTSAFSIRYSWLSIAVAALAHKQNKEPLVYFNGKGYDQNFGAFKPKYEVLNNIIGAKFIVLRVLDNHESMDDSYFSDHAHKIETTLRIGFKGGLHFLSDKNNPINITSLIFDGYKHYGRHLDISHIINRLFPLNEFCSISSNVIFNDNHKKNHNISDSQFLQLTDLLIGSVRSNIGKCFNVHQKKVSEPVQVLIDKWSLGKARMNKSRWKNGFCYSSCKIIDGTWFFDNTIKKATDIEQLSFGI